MAVLPLLLLPPLLLLLLAHPVPCAAADHGSYKELTKDKALLGNLTVASPSTLFYLEVPPANGNTRFVVDFAPVVAQDVDTTVVYVCVQAGYSPPVLPPIVGSTDHCFQAYGTQDLPLALMYDDFASCDPSSGCVLYGALTGDMDDSWGTTKVIQGNLKLWPSEAMSSFWNPVLTLGDSTHARAVYNMEMFGAKSVAHGTELVLVIPGYYAALLSP